MDDNKTKTNGSQKKKILRLDIGKQSHGQRKIGQSKDKCWYSNRIEEKTSYKF